MPLSRRDLLFAFPSLLGAAPPEPGFALRDVTAAAGIDFRHNSGAFGEKYLPETMGAGCAFLDFDRDGWMDILLVNGMDWPGHKSRRSTLKLYRNNGNSTFTDVTRKAGLDVEMYGMGVAVGDYDNDGFPDVLITCLGQNRLFHNLGDGRFQDVTEKSGLGGRRSFSTSALWFDSDGNGLLDLFVSNYVRWSPEIDVRCSVDGERKSYCTPEAYRGETCWLFRNRGDGTFEDVTAKAGLFDTTSKSLGAAILDVNGDGRLDLFVANDTQPNKLYSNGGDGRFEETALNAGVAFGEDGKARAGMGVDVADFDRSGRESIAVSNFNNEMLALFRNGRDGTLTDIAPGTRLGQVTRGSLGFACIFADFDLDGWLDLLVVNGHIDDVAAETTSAGHAQAPHLFRNLSGKGFEDIAGQVGESFARPRIGRGAATADFDLDGDVDLLITENNGAARLYRNEQPAGRQAIRFELTGVKSNRDAIGARVFIESAGGRQSQRVHSGSSYLSQSELPLTFGLGREDRADRVVVEWPSGRKEEFPRLQAGRRYRLIEGKGVVEVIAFKR
ncbi:MAG TPA: CRTAC1 family protein [Bryobacterales bacterium]|nr:CRTAC1 family protein [Bryobacterales bacterium]